MAEPVNSCPVDTIAEDEEFEESGRWTRRGSSALALRVIDGDNNESGLGEGGNEEWGDDGWGENGWGKDGWDEYEWGEDEQADAKWGEDAWDESFDQEDALEGELKDEDGEGKGDGPDEDDADVVFVKEMHLEDRSDADLEAELAKLDGMIEKLS